MLVNLQNNCLLRFEVTLPFWENFVIRQSFAKFQNLVLPPSPKYFYRDKNSCSLIIPGEGVVPV
jgi:hypothetical protein